MYKLAVLTTLVLTTLYSSQGLALSTEELQSLRNAVIQMCRGGTLSGSATRIETTGGSELIIKNLFANNPDLSVKLVQDEWNGIKALINPNQYSECVQYTLNLLVPAIDSKKNMDKDLSARMEYIKSNFFCDRLIHVVSLAPSDFSELRDSAPVINSSAGQWGLGPYLMGNPGALNMKTSNQYQGALVYFSNNSKTHVFTEDLLYTAQFGLSSETGFVLKQIEKAINKCFSFKAFNKVKGVRLRGGTYELSNGTKYWSFSETGFLGVSKETFIVTLALRKYNEIQVIDLAVHAPK